MKMSEYVSETANPNYRELNEKDNKENIKMAKLIKKDSIKTITLKGGNQWQH